MRQTGINPNEVELYGLITGIEIAEEFSISEGLTIAPTYAHIMAPFVMAFTPASPGGSHPGPWKSAAGGIAIDGFARIALARDARIGSFDRLNSIWFLAALMRLSVGSTIRVPVISDTEFSDVPSSYVEPTLWLVEARRSNYIPLPDQSTDRPAEGFSWIIQNIERGAEMMADDGFSLAMKTFDEAAFAETNGAAMVLLWSALEALFRPGDRDITKVLSRMISTYLMGDRRERDRLYPKVKDLYGVRGSMVHAARAPGADSIAATADLARRCFTKTIQLGKVPNHGMLALAWSENRTY